MQVMTGSYRHKRNKKRLMLYFFKVCHNWSDKGHFGSTMDMRMELMGHTTTYLLVETGQIDPIQ